MPKIVVVGQKFLSKYNNGDDFTINDTTDFSTHLKGGVLEEVKAVFNIQVSWGTPIIGYRYIYDNSANTLSINKDGIDWDGLGFSIGDLVKFSIASLQIVPNENQITGIVTAISEGEIRLNNVIETQGNLTNGTHLIPESEADDYVTGLTKKTALKYDFGLIENDEPINFLSKLTNTNQTYFYEGIDHNTPLTFVDGVTQGNNKAAYTGSSKVAFVGLVADEDYIYNEVTTQEFQIEHIFKINPVYRDGQIDSLKGTDIPPLDIFNGNLSLKYVLQSEFRTVLTNPNTSMISSYDTQLGSVGYLDESYNGFVSDYTIEDLVYTNLTDNITSDRLEVGKQNRVAFTVKSALGNIDANIPLIVGHTAILDSTEYVNSTEDYSTLWVNQSLRTTDGAGSLDGDIITAYQIARTDANTLIVTFDVDFSTVEQRNKLSENQDYLLYYTIGDPTKTVDQGSKVTGRIDVNYYSKSSDISGLFDVLTLDQYPIPYDFDKGVSTGFTSGKMFIEDEQFCYSRFSVLNTYLGESGNLSEDVTLEDLTFKIVAYNTVTNTWFDLRSLSIDLSDQIVSGNIQSIDLDTTRGYILTDTDIFNSLKLTTDTNILGRQYYDLEIGYKIPWQDWLALPNADTIFLDRAKSQNGLNQNASNYSGVNDYVIKILIEANLETTGTTTNYVQPSGDFEAYNYNTDDQDPDAYSCVINTFKKDGTPILNNVIQDGFTEVRAVITPVDPPVDVGDVDMTEVSTLWNRYAHANLQDLTVGGTTGVWADNQANDTDVFYDGAVPFLKGAGTLYSSTASTITANDNCGALYGCYSLNKYEFYSITGKMYVDTNLAFNDNDQIVYDICFFADEFGVENKISLVATTGGIDVGQNPAYVSGDETVRRTVSIFDYQSPSIAARWALVYNHGKDDSVVIETSLTGKTGFTWLQAGDLMFDIQRSANNITVDVDWTIDAVQYTDTFNYDLNANAYTQKFIGVQNIGFGFLSQDGGGFKDVKLSNPSTGYYGDLRMEIKDNPSDFGMNELNTEIVNTDSSLLKQISGDENKANLAFDGTDFIIQGLVNTDNITQGEEYKFSALLRRKDLEV